MDNILRNTAEFAMCIVSEYIKAGDVAIDATCGNGHDTLALAKLVGEKGKVYGFDVSGIAIRTTMELLTENDVEAEIELIYSGHEEMINFIDEKPSAIVFNLGYLPGEDKTKTTKTDTTMTALMDAVNMITKDGIVSVVIYPGHNEGERERNAILSWSETLDKSTYHAAHIKMINQPDNAPEILLITRKK